MSEYIPVIDEQPDRRKKGLRMKVTGVVVDDQGYLEQIEVEWSTYDCRGVGWIKVKERQENFKGALFLWT